jgi:hypothetical protein
MPAMYSAPGFVPRVFHVLTVRVETPMCMARSFWSRPSEAKREKTLSQIVILAPPIRRRGRLLKKIFEKIRKRALQILKCGL